MKVKWDLHVEVDVPTTRPAADVLYAAVNEALSDVLQRLVCDVLPPDAAAHWKVNPSLSEVVEEATVG